jgi:hypothetical protein
MPFSLTVLIGLVGSFVGSAVAAALYGAGSTFDTSGHAFVTLMLEVGVAIGLVGAYRRFVQKRPLWGPEAHRFPTRGFGVARMRSRLHRLGVDPDRLGRNAAPPTPEDPREVTEALERLRELHDRGELSDEAYEEARERLRRY